MTEPIAVDAPAKPVFSRSAPTGAPALPAATPPAPAPTLPVPKVETPKVEPPKPATPTATTAATVAAAAGVPVPPAAVGTAQSLLARFSKKQLVIGATAALSLFAGVGAVRLMFPAKTDAPQTTAATDTKDSKVTLPPPAALSPPQPKTIETRDNTGLPPVPSVALPEIPAPPPGLRTSGHSVIAPAVTPDPRLAPPAASVDPRPTPVPPLPTPDLRDPRFATATPPPLPVPAPDLTPPPVALPRPDIMLTGGSEPPKPPAVTSPALPAVPTTPGVSPLPVPTPGGPPALSALPAAVDLTPPVTPGTGVPKPPEPNGLVPPVVPSPGPGGTALPVPKGLEPMPGISPLPVPTPGGTATPLPKPGDLTPPGALLPGGPPKLPDQVGVSPLPLPRNDPPATFPLPTDVPPRPVPKLEIKPVPQPGVGVLPPALDPPLSGGTPTNFVKPAGELDAKPPAPAFAPRTTFDVDLHHPTDKDSYESIAQEFYNDKRFAVALKAFNANKPLGAAPVNVPPLHVLKRQFPNQTGGGTGGAVTPVGGSGAPATGAPQWNTAPARPAAGRSGVFVVPPGGMTLVEIARQTMGTGQRWRDISDLNLNITDTAAPVAAGTEVKLPPDARVP